MSDTFEKKLFVFFDDDYDFVEKILTLDAFKRGELYEFPQHFQKYMGDKKWPLSSFLSCLSVLSHGYDDINLSFQKNELLHSNNFIWSSFSDVESPFCWKIVELLSKKPTSNVWADLIDESSLDSFLEAGLDLNNLNTEERKKKVVDFIGFGVIENALKLISLPEKFHPKTSNSNAYFNFFFLLDDVLRCKFNNPVFSSLKNISSSPLEFEDWKQGIREEWKVGFKKAFKNGDDSPFLNFYWSNYTDDNKLYYFKIEESIPLYKSFSEIHDKEKKEEMVSFFKHAMDCLSKENAHQYYDSQTIIFPLTALAITFYQLSLSWHKDSSLFESMKKELNNSSLLKEKGIDLSSIGGHDLEPQEIEFFKADALVAFFNETIISHELKFTLPLKLSKSLRF